MNQHKYDRRRFLKHSLHATLLGSGMAAMNGKLNLISSSLAASGDYAGLTDYKALVCVFLYGGSDSFNLFVPFETGQYNNYAAARGELGVAQNSLLPGADNIIGFKAELGNLRDYYNSGELAIVGNVGNLISPVSRDQYLAGSASIPADLFAHNHQQEQWLKGYSSQPVSVVGAGWGGRMADLLTEANDNSDLPPTFSMNDSNYWLPGNNSTAISVNPVHGPRLMTYMDQHTGGTANVARDATLARILDIPTTHLIKQFAGRAFARARDSSRLLSAVLENSPDFNTSFDSGDRLAAQLRMVARLIAGRDQLSMRRQIFFVGIGGWDTHDNQTVRLDALAQQLNNGLASFQETIKELGVAEQVTTFTASDFGRTVTINGDGSDHGWSGHYLVMGGAVKGGQLVGGWPDLAVGGDDDVGDKGRIIPRLSVNQYGAALASWMGLSDSDVADVFPDLVNFDDGWKSRFNLFRA